MTRILFASLALLLAAAGLARADGAQSLIAMAHQIETGAQAGVSGPDADAAALIRDLEAFARDAQMLSGRLRAAGAPADLPCIFSGMSEDALEHAAALANANANGAADLAGIARLARHAVIIASSEDVASFDQAVRR